MAAAEGGGGEQHTYLGGVRSPSPEKEQWWGSLEGWPAGGGGPAEEAAGAGRCGKASRCAPAAGGGGRQLGRCRTAVLGAFKLPEMGKEEALVH